MRVSGRTKLLALATAGSAVATVIARTKEREDECIAEGEYIVFTIVTEAANEAARTAADIVETIVK